MAEEDPTVRGRLARLESVVLDALALDGTDRTSYLERSCAGDSDLRTEAEWLLGHERRLAGFLDERTLSIALTDLGPFEPLTTVDRQIGPYRLVECVGLGGMGEVYRAERSDGAFRQTVAVKLLRADLRTPELLDRFRLERQLHADLAHPNIARLLDGGSDSGGRPFLVMEYIDGTPITEYCREHRLTLDARVTLFRTVCAAVQEAHRRLVVHCDLKPSNILVTSKGEVKLLDFGIAQVLGTEAGSTALQKDGTRPDGDSRRLSIAYASPELVRGERATVSADVYSLGIVLRELLTGDRTAAARDLRRASVPADLAAVVEKAVQEVPANRYPSVEALHEDLRRWQERFPVHARPRSWRYRTGLFLRRNAAAVATLSTAGIALLILLGINWSLLIEARAARDAEADSAAIAVSEAEAARTISEFLRAVLGSVDPATARGRDTSLVVAMLDQAGQRLERGAGLTQPALASLHVTIGSAYRSLAAYDDAERHLATGLAIARRHGEDDEAIADAASALGTLFLDTDRQEAARKLFRESIERRSRLDPEHPGLGSSWRHLAHLERDLGNALAAEDSCLEAIRRDRAAGRRDELVTDLLEYGVLLTATDRASQAIDVLREALDMATAEFGGRHPSVARAHYNLAWAHRRAGRPTDAFAEYEIALRLHRELLHPTHPDIASTLNNMAGALEEMGRLAEAEPMYRSAIEQLRSTLGKRHVDVATAENNLAGVLRATGRLDEATDAYLRTIGIYRDVLGRDHPWNAVVAENLARTAEMASRWNDARIWIDECLRIRGLRPEAEQPWRLAQANSLLARCLLEEGATERAAALARESWSTLSAAVPPDHRSRAIVRPRVIEVLTRAGFEDEAREVAEDDGP